MTALGTPVAIVPNSSFHFLSYVMPATATRKRMEGTHDVVPTISRADLIRNIAGWQYEEIDRVYCAEGETFKEVTRDVAEAVMDLLVADRSEPCWEQRNWLEENLGIRAVRAVCPEREDA
jgi:hypothetical protein